MSTELRSAFTLPDAGVLGSARRLFDAIFAAGRALDAPPVNLALDGDAHELAAVLDEVANKIVARSVAVRHAYSIAHMVPPPATVAVIADAIIGALNQCAFITDEAPLAAALEHEVILWLLAQLKLPAGFGGVLTTGGTQSTTMAVRMALEQAVNRGFARERLAIVASDQAHLSIEKAALLAGLPVAAVHRIATDSRGCLRLDDVERLAAEIERRGGEPFFFLCTAGTTAGGRLEPATPFIRGASRRGAWCHVDAAYGGMASLMRDRADEVKAWAGCDSLSWDPHKTLFASYASGALMLRDPAALRLFSVPGCYGAGDPQSQPGWGHIDGSRRLEALKLWMMIRCFGTEGFRRLIEATVVNARWFADRVAASQELTLLDYPDTNIVLFGVRSDDLDDRNVNEAHLLLQQQLFVGGGPQLSTARVGGRLWLRAVLLNPVIEVAELEAIVQCLEQEATSCAAASAVDRRYDNENRSRHQPAS